MHAAIYALIPAALGLAVPAAAAVQTVNLGVDFAGAPYTYVLGTKATITFTALPDFFNPAGVSTGGTTQVASLGAPFYDPPQPTSYFTNRGGSIGPDLLAQFVSYPAPAPVPFSIVRGLVGLRFDTGQGYRYGYADIAGSTLYGFRFETTPGVAVNLAAVPEPATWALLIGGFAMAGTALRRRRALAA